MPDWDAARVVTGHGMEALAGLLAGLIARGVTFNCRVGEADPEGWAVSLLGY